MHSGQRHQGQQAEGFQRHGFAARVRAGDQQGRELLAEFHVNRNHFAGQQRVTGVVQADDTASVQFRLDAFHLFGKDGFGVDHVQMAQNGDQALHLVVVAADKPGQVAQNAVNFLLLFDAQLLQFVAQVYHALRLDEDGRAGLAGVMHDAAEGFGVFGFDGDAVAPLAHGNDEVLNKGANAVAGKDALQAVVQAAAGDFDGAAQASEFWGGRIAHVARLADAGFDTRLDDLQNGQVGRHFGQERNLVLPVEQEHPHPATGRHRVHHVQQLEPDEARLNAGAFRGFADVVNAAERQAAVVIAQFAGLAGLLQGGASRFRGRGAVRAAWRTRARCRCWYARPGDQ